MSKIRHLAIMCVDPEKTGSFYEDVFDLKILYKTKDGSVFMTDGYMNLALLRSKTENTQPGLYHFGFHVEDGKETDQRISEITGRKATVRPDDRPYAETRGMDPDGNLFDISVHGYMTEEFAPKRREKTDAKEKLDA